MMSKGPCRPDLSAQAGSRTIRAASTCATPRSRNTRRNPSRSSRPADLARAACCRRTTPAPNARSGRACVALHADLLGHVEHDRHRQDVVVAGQVNQRAARVRLHVRRVDHGEPAELEPLGGDRVQRGEGRRGDRLVVLVVADQAAEGVRGQHLCRPEMPGREAGLAGPAHADQDDQAQPGDLEIVDFSPP